VPLPSLRDVGRLSHMPQEKNRFVTYPFIFRAGLLRNPRVHRRVQRQCQHVFQWSLVIHGRSQENGIPCVIQYHWSCKPCHPQPMPPPKSPSDPKSECGVPGRYRLFVLFGIMSKLTLLALVGRLPSFILWPASSASISMSYPCCQKGESTSINAVSFSEHSSLSE